MPQYTSKNNISENVPHIELNKLKILEYNKENNRKKARKFIKNVEK